MNKKTLSIALDFDGTVTADQAMWAAIVQIIKNYGHTVTIVTMRSNNGKTQDIELFAADCGISVVYCAHQPKRKVFQADIWIDDMPELIPYNRISESGLIIPEISDYGG